MPKINAKSRNKILIIVVWVVAAAVLVAALVYFNFVEKEADKSHVIAIGGQVPDFTVKTYNDENASEFTFSQMPDDVEVTVINFWATWCGPCVMELPEFIELQKKYDNVKIIAVHGDYVDEDVLAFINNNGWDSVLFAQDEVMEISVKNNYGITETVSDTLYNLFGGTGPLPMTVVLDADGVMRYRCIGSITYKDLEQAVMDVMSGQN